MGGYVRARPHAEWWTWFAACALEAMLLDTWRRRVRHETRYTRWP